MKLATVTIKNFRRFTDLTIQNIPESARLIMLTGPNGCGKSSLFDAFALWHDRTAPTRRGIEWDSSYRGKVGASASSHNGSQILDQITLKFHDALSGDANEQKKRFYIRSAYRNDPEFQIQQLNRSGPILDEQRIQRLIDNDAAVSKNYRRMVSDGFQEVYEDASPTETIGNFREWSIAEVRDPFRRLFPDLTLNSLSNPLVNGTFRFTKGSSKGFEFKNLSGGKKAAFDLILDIVVRSREFNNTVFCIDEPESHMNARLQAELLQVLYELIPPNCQLVMATHSISMMRRAQDIETDNPGTVAFLDFGNLNFDEAQVIEPIKPNRKFWQDAYAVAFDDLAALVAPKRVVICEGHPVTMKRGPNHGHDADCYNTIFGDNFPDTRFVSMGNKDEVIGDKHGFGAALRLLTDGVSVIQLIDHDDSSPNMVNRLQQDGIRVLSRRNLESYLYDDEVIKALAMSEGQPDKIGELLAATEKARASALAKGKAPDDLKPAAGLIYVACTKILGLTQHGNDAGEFARETLAPLIEPGMVVYDELEKAIFGDA